MSYYTTYQAEVDRTKREQVDRERWERRQQVDLNNDPLRRISKKNEAEG